MPAMPALQTGEFFCLVVLAPVVEAVLLTNFGGSLLNHALFVVEGKIHRAQSYK